MSLELQDKVLIHSIKNTFKIRSKHMWWQNKQETPPQTSNTIPQGFWHQLIISKATTFQEVLAVQYVDSFIQNSNLHMLGGT